MKINNRLKLIGDIIDKDSVVLDVGCDHALLCIYLTKLKKNIKAIASDIEEGPLRQARENISREKLDSLIEVRMGNGLDTYTRDINTVVICGMGGLTTLGILKNNRSYLDTTDTLVLSPNNYQDRVRKEVCKLGFYIDEEYFVKVGKFIYQVIKFSKGKKKYSKSEYFFGPKLLLKKDDLFIEYYSRELTSKRIVLSLLPKNYLLKRFTTKQQINLIERTLKKN